MFIELEHHEELLRSTNYWVSLPEPKPLSGFLPSIIYDCSRIHNLFQDHIEQERVYLPHTRCELEVIGCKSFSLSPSMCQRVCWNSNKSPVAHARVGLCFSLKITPGI